MTVRAPHTTEEAEILADDDGDSLPRLIDPVDATGDVAESNPNRNF